LARKRISYEIPFQISKKNCLRQGSTPAASDLRISRSDKEEVKWLAGYFAASITTIKDRLLEIKKTPSLAGMKKVPPNIRGC
jgi:hypothetical protein